MGIGVIATLKVQDGKADEFKAVMAELREAVMANEPGCKMYDLFTTAEDGNTFVVLEEYESQEAFDGHIKSPHFAAAQPKMAGCVAGPPDLKFLMRA